MSDNERMENVRSDVVWFQLSEDFCVSVWYAPDNFLGDQFQMKLELVCDDGRMGPACELVHDESYGTANLSYEALCETLNEVIQDVAFACEEGDLVGVTTDGLVDVTSLARDIIQVFGIEGNKNAVDKVSIDETLAQAVERSHDGVPFLRKYKDFEKE